MGSLNINNFCQDVKEALRYIVLLPLIPIAFGIAFFFGWIFSIGSKIPEDLEEQIKDNEESQQFQNVK